MNNNCPACAALYSVTPKDVGRRIRCKKCGTPLAVTEAGLVVDTGDPAPTYAGGEYANANPDPAARKPMSLGGFDPVRLFRDFGGLSSMVFGFGAFLVIVFVFLPIIGQAATARAQASVERLDLRRAAKVRQMQREKRPPDEIKKAEEDFDKEKEALEEEARNIRIANIRDVWMERYGMMFGFVFLMIGSIGFLMPQHTTTRRVVGAVVLSSQMVLVFVFFVVRGA